MNSSLARRFLFRWRIGADKSKWLTSSTATTTAAFRLLVGGCHRKVIVCCSNETFAWVGVMAMSRQQEQNTSRAVSHRKKILHSSLSKQTSSPAN